jgi:16S rRNA A1518/A1519 N6-dimethyltransferase RsmA/KsgA/DIM1 with predicted DNA glycosylase/AP lyase activity
MVRNAVRDLRYGGLLGGTIKTSHAHLGAHDVGNADYDDLTELFAQVEIGPEDVIVDVGCGKGRAINWFLSHHPRTRIYGLELEPDVCAKTAHRLRRHANVTILCGDATELLPADGTVFYLFNPFGPDVLARFIAAFLAVDAPRKRTIVYYNCKFVELFQAEPRVEVRMLERPRSFRSALIRER